MRRFALPILLLVASMSFAQNAGQHPAPATIQQVPEMQRASAEEIRSLFDAMNLKPSFDTMMKTIQTQTSAVFEQEMNKLSPPPSPRMMREFRASMEEISKLVNVDDLLNDLIPIYQKYMTRDEIAAIRAFYDSPAGKSMLAKSPAMMQEYMQVAMPKQMQKMQAAMAALQERMKKAVEEEKADRKSN